MTDLNLPPWAEELLRDSRVAHLATADANGRPLVVTICFVWDGVNLYSAIDAKPKTTRRLRRVRNIEENSRISLIVDRWHETWSRLRHVIVDGKATIIEDGDEWRGAITALRAKYPQYQTMDVAVDFGAVIRIEPLAVRCWRGDAGA